jgi:mRNA deadenylase 3'-5' endonuclease subunit Ccr4
MYRAGAMIELLKGMAKYEVDVCALQEIRRKNYMIVYSR